MGLTESSPLHSGRHQRPAALHRPWIALAPLLGILIAFSLLGSPPPVSRPSRDPSAIDRLIAQLNHEKLKERQEASAKLLAGGLAVLPPLRRALQQEGLSLERRRRLEWVIDE